MPTTAAQIADKARKRLALSDKEIPPPDMDECIRDALLEYSRHRTNRVFGTIAIDAQVIDYPYPDGLEELIDFYYAPDTILGNISFEEEVLMAIQGNIINIDFGGNIFENPTLVTIWFSKMKEFRENIGLPPWRVMENPVSGPTIRLGQIPEEDGIAYYEGKGPWTIAQIYPKDMETFLKACLWKAAEWRANKISVLESYSEGNGIQVRPASKYWSDRADKYKNEFLTDVGYFRAVIQVG